MSIILTSRLLRALDLTWDLAESLQPDHLKFSLDNLASNTIHGQFWCIIGARESYSKAVNHGEWKGFECSLSGEDGLNGVIALLQSTRDTLAKQITGTDLSPKQEGYAFDLLEHEIQHHGQLIRYMYANRLQFPKSWNERYTV